MREIKFRAWYKGDHFPFRNPAQMFYDIQSFHHTVPPLSYSSLGGLIKDGDFEVMQYTGLKDKNGREIYEGDWLKIFGGVNSGRKCAVVWESEKACFRGNGNFLWQYLDKFEGVEFEVIGNIYENPELLEV